MTSPRRRKRRRNSGGDGVDCGITGADDVSLLTSADASNRCALSKYDCVRCTDVFPFIQSSHISAALLTPAGCAMVCIRAQ